MIDSKFLELQCKLKLIEGVLASVNRDLARLIEAPYKEVDA